MMRKILLMSFIFMCALLIGCTNESKTSTTTKEIFYFTKDSLNRDVIFETKPERMVVTSASFLEPLHAVGGTVVGRPDSKTQMPDWAKDIESIGQVYNVDVEKIIACNPDLVIINKGMNEKLLDVLKQNKINAMVLDMKTYADVKNEIEIFGDLTEQPDKAEKIIDDMNKKINQSLKNAPQDKKRVAIIHSTAQGLTVQLERSIAGNIVEMFGWENVCKGMTPLENNPDAAPYSLEKLAEQNPDVIFITSMGKIDDIKSNMEKEFKSNSAWQTIKAIKNGKIYYLPQDLFLLSPGLRYPEAVEMMSKLIKS